MERLIIHDKPLSEYGVILAPNSYKSVLQWSKFKSIDSNDWAEYDYLEYDLTHPTLDKRTVTLYFHAKGEDGYRTFMEYLKGEEFYTTYDFIELGIKPQLRVNASSLSHLGKWQSFSVNYSDDTPYFLSSPQYSTVSLPKTGYALDGVDLSEYGITILDGTLQSIIQQQQLKERLTISENSMDGAIYDYDGAIQFQSGTFTLKILLRAANLALAVRNYYYLYNLLRQSGTRRITVEKRQETIDCFYNQCTVNDVHSKLLSGYAGIVFDLSFNIIYRNNNL